MAEAAVVERADGQVTVVRLSHYGKTYKRLQAVTDVNLEVHRGMLYGLLGPDGAGKSSILKSIGGVLTYEQGTLEVFGITVDSERAGELVKDRLGFMPQGLGLNLYQELSIDENIDFFADLRLVPRHQYEARKEELLAITRLAEVRSRRMSHLSGGMKQKLGLICALIHDPQLLVLDEPTTGVDPVSRRDFWTILSREVHQRNITAIVSTAYMDEASRFDRIAVMHEGRLLAEGAPTDVVGGLQGTVVSMATEDQAKLVRNLRHSFRDVDAMADRIRVRLDATAEEASQAIRAAAAGVPFTDLRIEEPTLEDTFVFMLGGKKGVSTATDDTPAPQQSDTEAIVARGLTRAYDGFVAAGDVRFTVRHGEVFGLLGANGAGKTTVIKMLTGIAPSTSGYGEVAGVDIALAGKAVKRKIGYVSQSFSLYQDLTVQENILLYAGIYGLGRAESRKRLEWIIDFGGLKGFEKARSGGLPLGLRQRLALGCALVHQPSVLFLDEPTSGVDPLGRRDIWDLLFALSREHGVGILVTTHYMSEAEHCDKLALMHSGRIVANASPQDLKGQLLKEAGRLLEIGSSDPDGSLAALRNAGFECAQYGRSVHLFSHRWEQDAAAIQSLLPSADVRPVDISMEDVFVHRISTLEDGKRRTGAAA